MYTCTAFFIFWGIRGDDNLQSMLVGAVMRKIKSRTWKKQRYFKLQDDGMTIWYKSKKAGNTHSTCKDTGTWRIHSLMGLLYGMTIIIAATSKMSTNSKESLLKLNEFMIITHESCLACACVGSVSLGSPLFIFVHSFSEWCGDNTRGPPVWGPAQHCRWVPGQPVLHAGLPWSQGQPGPSGWVGWGGAVLDPRHEEADWEPGEHGRARAIGPVSFALSLKICCRLAADLLLVYHSSKSPQNHRWVFYDSTANFLGVEVLSIKTINTIAATV